MSVKKADLRKVLIMDGSGAFTIKGYFHEWGIAINSTEPPSLNETKAIIELEDGTINFHEHRQIKFLIED